MEKQGGITEAHVGITRAALFTGASDTKLGKTTAQG